MNTFCCGQEVASFVASSDLLKYSWNSIFNCYQHSPSADPTAPLSVVFNNYEENGINFVAFATSPPCDLQLLQRDGGCDFISLEDPTAKVLFDFICTKTNRSFSIHRAAIQLFASIINRLSLLKQQLCGATKLIITGHSLGGSVASLFTLWLLDSLPKDKKPPLCITFGSPLVGDHGFQQAILERPTWNARFLHVVYKQDPIPLSFNFQQTPIYEPFGTFFFCSGSNYSFFEESEVTLKLMMAMRSELAQGQYVGNSIQIIDYGQILGRLDSKIVSQGISLPGNLCVTPLKAGITVQLEAIGVLQDGNFSPLAINTEQILARVKKSPFDPSKKLNEMKKEMVRLEWYKKSTVEVGGYYDCFKNVQYESQDKIISRQEIVKSKKILDKSWKRIVEEAEKMPQKGVLVSRTRWLYAGTNYRRMIEPLDIAEYYKKGKKDYRNQGRSKHYFLLEKWMIEDKKDKIVKQARNENKRNKALSLTEDSCFWADVEEAIICCKVLTDMCSSFEEKAFSREKLVRFEEFVMNSIESFSVSPEIFLRESTFMKWWLLYKDIVGRSYASRFALFMANDDGYRNYV